MLVSGGMRRFKCCVISAPEGAFGRFQACVIYIGLGYIHGRSLSGAKTPHGLRGAYYQADGRLRGPYSY